ncbi:endonuclease NucS [Candidatus Woesearchaeota archaeon]|nr:endonuclease NucS [Candidatus Woesearchaeota archaeon]
MLELRTTLEKLDKALKAFETIVIGCECKAEYYGRAKSFLGFGARLLLIKSDRTVLLHQPTGALPTNYMKNAIIKASIKDDYLLIRCEDLKAKERLDVYIAKVYFFNSYALKDNEKLKLSGNEQEMSDYILENPELIEEGFKPLSREEHTRYGFIDVFGYDKNNVLTVIECKRYKAGLDAVQQLRRYVEKIKSSKGLTKVRGILAAPDITGNALVMLKDFGFEFKKINPPKRLDISQNQSRLEHFTSKNMQEKA